MSCTLCNIALTKTELSTTYNCPSCGNFIMTHGFISLLNYLKIRYGQAVYNNVITLIKEQISKSAEVIAFVEDYEKLQHLYPRVLELDDITQQLGIDIIGNSRGSDYGD